MSIDIMSNLSSLKSSLKNVYMRSTENALTQTSAWLKRFGQGAGCHLKKSVFTGI